MSAALYMKRNDVLVEIYDERERQDRQWGGRLHDDRHRRSTWTRLIVKFAERAKRAGSRNTALYRASLVKAAALCVAAIEAHDRGIA